jgi:hypothetical protein
MNDAEEGLWRRLRHDLRGAYHQIRLCIDAAELENDPAARLEWLTWLEAAAARGVEVAQAMERAAADAADPAVEQVP